jgi:peptidoglycan/xylan/chitin deacetylase (PgdA/CDA1 family)
MASALHRALGERRGDRFAILLYHRCSPRVAGQPRPSMNVQPENFRAQLVGLRHLGYSAWPLARIIDNCRCGRAVPPKTFAITFDDGFESVYTQAWPVLREFQMPATVFLATSYLNSQAAFPFDRWGQKHEGEAPAEAYRPLTLEQCQEMMEDGLVDFGAHTHTHADFRDRPAELREDLQVCLSTLREALGIEEAPFAFPSGKSRLGYVDNSQIAAVRMPGVTCALTTDWKTANANADPFGWGRFNVYDFDTPQVLAAKIEGWCDWLERAC